MRYLGKLGKWVLILAGIVLFFLVLGWALSSIGLDGWQKTEEAWSGIRVGFIVVKYAIVLMLAKNWNAVCMWYGRKRGAEEFGVTMANNWHVFLVTFVVIEVVGFIS